MNLRESTVARHSRRTLGIVVQDRSLLLADVRAGSSHTGGLPVATMAEFNFPQGASLDDPQALGKSLRQFLKQNGLKARRAVIGLPARSLMMRRLNVPPVEGDTLTGVLRLQAERAFASDVKDLALDFAADADADGTRRVLLVAALSRRVEQLVAMARAAGLSVEAVVSSTMALNLATAQDPAAGAEAHDRGNLVVYVDAHGAEVSLRRGGRFELVRHLPLPAQGDEATAESSAALIAALSNELRLAIAQLPGQAPTAPPAAPGGAPGGRADEGPASIQMWDALGLAPAGVESLGQRMSVDVRQRQGVDSLVHLNGQAGSGPAINRFAPAVAVALSGGERRQRPIDLLHSQLAPPKQRAIGKRWRTGALAAGAAVAVAAGLFIDWRQSVATVDALNKHLAQIEPDKKAAQQLIDKAKLASEWFDRRPQRLEALRELTVAFPSRPDVWATSFTLNDKLKGAVTGQGIDEKAILSVMDQLKASANLGAVKMLYMRQSKTGRDDRGVTFAIAFAYVPPTSAPAKPAAGRAAAAEARP